MCEINFYVRQTSNGYYVRVTKGLFGFPVILRFVATSEEELGKKIAEATKALRD
ncbi:MAG: hypothetical protein PVH61_31730 [Candidatus Aminicenantes bacterium]